MVREDARMSAAVYRDRHMGRDDSQYRPYSGRARANDVNRGQHPGRNVKRLALFGEAHGCGQLEIEPQLRNV